MYNTEENSIRGGYKASGYSGLREDLLTQIEKTPEPLSHLYTAAPQLREISWPQTRASDVGQAREFFSPWSLQPKPQRVSLSGLKL
jgi:hypothetical protein